MAFTTTPIANKELAAKVAALERQIKDANSEARKAPLMAQLNAILGGSSPSSAAVAKPATSFNTASSVSSFPIVNKELAAQIASLERQIKDANSEARKAPLMARLNALKGEASFSAPQASAKASFTPNSSFSAAPIFNKELDVKGATLERQITEANSEATKATLMAPLNALKGKNGKDNSPSFFSASQPSAKASFTPDSSFTSSSIVNNDILFISNMFKEVAAKVASLERHIKNANSEARKAPLMAQLNALRLSSTSPSSAAAKPISSSNTSSSISSFPISNEKLVAQIAPQASAKASFKPASSLSAAPILNKELAAKVAALERQIMDANSEARKAPLKAQLNVLLGGSSYSSPSSAAAKPISSFNTSSISSFPIANKELAAQIASLERQIKDANSEARRALLSAQLNALRR